MVFKGVTPTCPVSLGTKGYPLGVDSRQFWDYSTPKRLKVTYSTTPLEGDPTALDRKP